MSEKEHHHKKKGKHVLIHIMILAIIMGSLLYYTYYSVGKARIDYNEKIAVLRGKFESDLADAKTNLTAQIDLLDNLLENAQRENQQKIITLTSLIEEIEEKSDLQLTELKTELKSIQIKSADFSAIVDDVLEGVVSVRTDVGQGSGAIISRDGFIVTNLHVINGASRVEIYTYDKDTYDVSLVGYDGDADIAVLKINENNLAYLEFTNSGEVNIGDKVIALGNPAGLDFTVTEGIISAERKASNNLDYFQTDVPLNPGNSGGPLVNKEGYIVGINNFKVGGYESLGFSLTSNDVEEAVDSIMANVNASYP